jgi:hypothetical protein
MHVVGESELRRHGKADQSADDEPHPGGQNPSRSLFACLSHLPNNPMHPSLSVQMFRYGR